MDVAALSVALSQSNVQQQASLSVLKLAMNTAEQNGKNIAEMLKGSQPAVSLELHLGNTVDLKG
ncbi:putative motility protein [Bacillaceae bacterium ZC4]|jgi:hypothetical protein|uniref:YjfB family protein n=1 Tax=Aeribacillus composti TaxID=1868734 RepID=A0ABY9WBX9_9BACI|nr:YjfB family protein [Aeribacillus composti]AXI39022.1 putative motility protein [Bacillaceae bacterium ZC4]WNF33654.1 YjfB family protein [Aeribacillus composti]